VASPKVPGTRIALVDPRTGSRPLSLSAGLVGMVTKVGTAKEPPAATTLRSCWFLAPQRFRTDGITPNHKFSQFKKLHREVEGLLRLSRFLQTRTEQHFGQYFRAGGDPNRIRTVGLFWLDRSMSASAIHYLSKLGVSSWFVTKHSLQADEVKAVSR
jgi:hypothetical protein